MPRVVKYRADAGRGLDRSALAVVGHRKAAHERVNVVNGVHRSVPVLARAFGAAVLPHSLRLLDVSRIGEHDGGKVACGARRIHRTAESVFYEQRQLARMVYMRMCEKNKIDIGGRTGQLAVFVYIGTLLHSAVNKYFSAAGFKQGAGAGHLVCRSEKVYFHMLPPCVFGNSIIIRIFYEKNSAGGLLYEFLAPENLPGNIAFSAAA